MGLHWGYIGISDWIASMGQGWGRLPYYEYGDGCSSGLGGGGGDGSSGNGSACYASTRTRGINRNKNTQGS